LPATGAQNWRRETGARNNRGATEERFMMELETQVLRIFLETAARNSGEECNLTAASKCQPRRVSCCANDGFEQELRRGFLSSCSSPRTVGTCGEHLGNV